MKKQLLAGAVAMAIAGSAAAAVEITGAYKGVLKTDGSATNLTQNIDLSLKGTTGDSTVVVNMDIDDNTATNTSANTIAVSEAYATTKIGDLSVKVGNMKGLAGSGIMNKKSPASAMVRVGTTMAGIQATVAQKADTTNATTGLRVSNDPTLDLATGVGGIKIKIQNALNDSRFITVSGELGKLNTVVEHTDGATGLQISTKIGDSVVTFVNINADGTQVSQDDGIFGNIAAANDVSGVVIAVPSHVGKITGKYWNKDDSTVIKGTLSQGNMHYSVTKAENADATYDAKLQFKF